MKAYRHLKVLNTTYKVFLAPAMTMENLGFCEPDNQRICLRDDMSEEKFRDTLLHEVLHAIYSAFQLQDGETEERVVGNLATGLMTVLDENPWLREDLMP